MTAFICLLRGVNVGGNRKIPMPELQAMFHAMGLSDARTWINSGNVVFSADEDADSLTDRIEAAILRTFGHPVWVAVRTVDQMAAMLADNPLPAGDARNPSRVLVHLLRGAPLADGEARTAAIPHGDEEFALRGQAFYVHYRTGMADSKLGGATLDRVLGVQGTARNLNTLAKLVELARGL